MRSLPMLLALALLTAVGPLLGAEDWQLEQAVDPMNDEPRVSLTKTAAEGTGVLGVSCNGDSFGMALVVLDVPTIDEMVNGGMNARVNGRWRIDEEKSDKITFWAPRANLQALEPHSNFSRDAKRFLRKLEGRRQVVFSVEGIDGYLTFDLAGLDTSALVACYKP